MINPMNIEIPVPDKRDAVKIYVCLAETDTRKVSHISAWSVCRTYGFDARIQHPDDDRYCKVMQMLGGEKMEEFFDGNGVVMRGDTGDVRREFLKWLKRIGKFELWVDDICASVPMLCKIGLCSLTVYDLGTATFLVGVNHHDLLRMADKMTKRYLSKSEFRYPAYVGIEAIKLLSNNEKLKNRLELAGYIAGRS